jgi:superfamily II DNA/RNA helicase
MVFTRTKRTAQKVADDLTERGFAAAAVHGDLGQGAREQALRAFRSGKVDVLVATDVAARGIDIDDVTHVINFQCPEDEKTYVHRIGRTGRAGREGVAITLVDWDEEYRWKTINDALNLGKPEAVETYSTSDHLFSDLGIPAGSTGRLPLGMRTRAGLDAEPEEDLSGGKKRRSKRAGATRTRTRSSNGSATEAPATTTEGEERPPRQRQRRRRRAGADVATTVATGEEAPAAAQEPSEKGDDAPRKRRRRRSGVEVAPDAGESS